ncbi:MAG: hypothetical protein ABH879_06720 [archaeon]
MRKTLGQIATGLALVSAFTRVPTAEADMELGHNALETARIKDSGIRTRAVSNVSVDGRLGSVGYWGMNELTNLDTDTYFGRHVGTAGKNDARYRAAVVAKAIRDGVIDTKVGVRDTGLMEKLGGYGWLDFVADKSALNVTGFFGKPLPYGLSGSLYQDVELPFKGKPTAYTEMQIETPLNERISAFGRAEIPGMNPGNGSYIVGIVMHN